MVNQANNNTGDLVTYYKTMAQSFGTWMALANTRDRLKQNLILNDRFKRAIQYDFQYGEWDKGHKWGQEFARLYAENSEKLPDLMRRRPTPAVNSTVAKTLVGKMLAKTVKVSSRSDETEPVWYRCACCETLNNYPQSKRTVTGRLICRDCVNNGYVRYSDCMDGYLVSGECVQVYHDAAAYEARDHDWATADWCQREGYSRRSSMYFSEDALEAYALPQGIYGYHSGPDLSKIISDDWAKRKPMVLLGMELEVENVCGDGDENVDNEDIAKSIYKSIGKVVKNYMKCERDGSLDNGFEIITAPSGLDTHAKALAELRKAEYFDEIHSHTTDTCGLHVHVCKAGMTTLHAAKLQQFINSRANEPLVRTIARRYQTGGSGYAKIEHGDWISRMAHLVAPAYRNAREDKKAGFGNGKIDPRHYIGSEFVYDRYSALNFRNDHTVEFRMFRGTLKYESIMACLEFAYACWFFTREASVKELTTENFMKFITRADNRKDTKNLRAYLKAKKFRAFYQAEQIARPKFKEAPPTMRDETIMFSDDPTVHISQHRVAA